MRSIGRSWGRSILVLSADRGAKSGARYGRRPRRSTTVFSRVLGNDGRERWIATRGQTHFENDKPVWFYGVAIDVTDRKRIEKTLERRVEARTRELEEAKNALRS